MLILAYGQTLRTRKSMISEAQAQAPGAEKDLPSLSLRWEGDGQVFSYGDRSVTPAAGV